MDLNYPFFEAITKGLINSLSLEAKFLGRTTISNVGENWEMILSIFGFLLYVFFGIIGCFVYLSKKYETKAKISLIFMLVILYFIFFVFPVFGIRNIVPYRWPAFIYVSFVLFVSIGLIELTNMLKNKLQKIVFIAITLLLASFFMITTSVSNMDSQVYSKELHQKLLWTTSEMELFKKVNNSYDGTIVADGQTQFRLFENYLARKKIVGYQLTTKGNIVFVKLTLDTAQL